MVCTEPFVTTAIAPIVGNPIASMGLAAGATCTVTAGAALCDHLPPATTTTLTPRFTSNVSAGAAFEVTVTAEAGATSAVPITVT